MTSTTTSSVAAHWDGLATLQDQGDGWQRPFRLDPTGEDYDLNPPLWDGAARSVGVRGRWTVDGQGTWTLPVRVPAEGQVTLDLIVDGELRRQELAAGEHRVSTEVDGPGEIDVWLPHNGIVDISAPVVTGTATAAPVEPSGPRWLTYGSSITQAGGADGPTQTWPALVAQRRGWRLWSLGFGGQCHLDPAVAERLAEAEADLISLCIGINIYGNGSFNARSLGPQLEGFIRRVRKGHPTTPMVLITPIVSPAREETANKVEWTLAELRAVVDQVGRSLIARGDANLRVVDGLTLISAEGMAGELSGDGLHPNTEGYRLIAEAIGPSLAEAMATGQPS